VVKVEKANAELQFQAFTEIDLLFQYEVTFTLFMMPVNSTCEDISIFKAIFRFIAFALSFRVISDGTHHTLGIFAGVCYLNSGEVGAHISSAPYPGMRFNCGLE
jgi:hypothetical protein